MGKNSPLTLQERKLIKKGIAKGLSSSKISETINRGKNTVNVEIRRSGGRESYNPEKTQIDSDRRIAQRMERLKKLPKDKSANPWKNLIRRIENLEMQLEITTDKLKELNENFCNKRA